MKQRMERTGQLCNTCRKPFTPKELITHSILEYRTDEVIVEWYECKNCAATYRAIKERVGKDV